ncbi:MAG: putative manganese transporter [Lachnospira sp.]
MLDVILDTLVDGVKLLPFLFLTYLAMEYIEHKTTAKTKNTIKKSGKLGPLVGGILGAFPQCGFSTAGSNLYAGRVITLGTLISIYLSTSDEMLPVFLSEKVPMSTILSMIAVKAVIGMVAGFIIDFVIRIRKSSQEQDFTSKIGHMCDHDHCHCDKSIVRSALNHTLTIFAFILVISFLLNTAVFFVGEDAIAGIILNRPVLGSILSGIVGLIPNCAASVVITQLYVEGVISIGATMSGLLVGAGAGLIVLFKENRDIKENIKIVALLYAIGVACGIIIDFIL